MTTGWQVNRTEQVRFYLEIKEDRRVVLAHGGGARVTGVSVTFRRKGGEEWGAPRVAVTHGSGWHLTVTSVPQELRGSTLPGWLAELVAEVEP